MIFTNICIIKLITNVFIQVLKIPIVKSLVKDITAKGEIITRKITVTYLIEKLIRIEITPKHIIDFTIPSKLKKSIFNICSIDVISSFKVSKVIS